MMDRRKFKRRKPAEGEVRNRILDEIEPGVTAPLTGKARRVFARASNESDGDMQTEPTSQRDILARAKEAMSNQPDAGRSIRPHPVSPGEDAQLARERIAELRREKARLQAERVAREERARARAAAVQAAEARRRAEEAQRQQAEQIERDAAERAELDLEIAERELAEERAAFEAEEREMAGQAVDDLTPEPEDIAHDEPEHDVVLPKEHAEPEEPTAAPVAVAASAAPLVLSAEMVRARAQAAVPAPAPVTETVRPSTDDVQLLWESLDTFAIDPRHFERNRIITAAREDLAHTAFDVLRTRLLQALRRRGWRRVAITSPSKDCGKTFSAANLALSLARQDDCRTILLDFDMRRPSLAKVFGAKSPGRLGDMLRGKVAPQDHLVCCGPNPFDIGRNLAIGFNSTVEPYASELLSDRGTEEVLENMEAAFNADVVLFDMPPALYHDDVIAARSLFDGVLLVVGGGITKAGEVKDVERRLGSDTPLLGTLLNFSEGPGITKYSY